MSLFTDPARREERKNMLVNRIRKNHKHRKKWAKREGISCYRLYDRDIPELPFIVDTYEGHLHASVFVHDDMDIQEARDLTLAWLEEIATSLSLNPKQTVLKVRARQSGKQQYTKRSNQAQRIEVNEAGLKFWINLHDYLDTGLFLDHRKTRERVSEEAHDKRFLNLFAYTGSFTVHAAAGGAAETVTVDSTQSYLQWAQDNLDLNRLSGLQHRFERADVRLFLDEEAHAVRQGLRPRYDLVVLDPPTFSNSKGAHPPFDVRRHHAELFDGLYQVMKRGAVLYFSNNAQRFSLHPDLEKRWEITEITSETIPLDFRQKRPHRCWRCLRR